MFTDLSNAFGSTIRPFTYINPYFADPSNYNKSNEFEHNYFVEGQENGYFIMNRSNETYLIDSISIKFATVDLTNPEAVKWIKRIIQQNLVENANSSGFMADFGEYIPFDAVFHDQSVVASEYHNEFAAKWAETVRDAICEVGMDDKVIPFHRSAALYSPKSGEVSEGAMI